MSKPTWLRSLIGSSARQRAVKRARKRNASLRRHLTVESLETRYALATITVTTANDVVNAGDGFISLREAVTAANLAGPDTINFAPALNGQTITLNSGLGELSLTETGSGNATTITGLGAANLAVSGNNTTRVFNIAAGVTANISGLTIRNGNSGAGIGGGILSFGTLELTSVAVTANAGAAGGGITNFGGALTVVGSTISGNSNGANAVVAGGILGQGGPTTLRNSTIANNTGNGVNNDNVLTVTNCTIAGNTGAGIQQGATLNLANTILANNTGGDLSNFGTINASGGNIVRDGTGGVAGAIVADPLLGPLANNGGPTETMALTSGSPAINAGANASIPVGITTDQRGVPFTRTSGTVDIGAFEVQSLNLLVDIATDEDDGNFAAGDLSLREAVRLANLNPGADTINFAGGITTATLSTAALTLSDAAKTTLNGGASGVTIARSSAGGTPDFRIFLVTGSAEFNNLTITNGRGFAPGIRSNLGTVTINGSTITGNIGSVDGGLSNFQGTMTVTNSTISGNSVTGAGGGVVNSGTMNLTNVTITNNRADSDGVGGEVGGGLLNFAPGVITIQNSLVAGNFRGTGTTRDDVIGTINGASSNNLIGDGTGLTGITNGNQGNQIGTGALPIDPLLGPLASNGGPTQTHALLAGSPAINAGSNANIPGGVTTDQRGVPFTRTSGTVDIGAFEVQTLSLLVDIATDEDDGNFAAGDLSLREAVRLANSNPGADTINFAAGLGGQTITLGGKRIDIRGAVNIVGPNSGVTIDGNLASQIFYFDGRTAGSFVATLSNLTLTRGRTLGGEVLIDGFNSGSFGGGFLNDGADVTLTSVTVSNNVGTNNGGGLYNWQGVSKLTLINSAIVGNTSAGAGGGIYNWAGATLTAINSTFSGNLAGGNGGGVRNDAGTAVLTNVTATLNRADNDNNASGSGGFLLNTGTATLNNTLVAGNFRGTGATVDDLAGNAIVAASFNNLIGTGGAGGLVNGNNGNLVGVANPLLGPLTNNGGPTQTHALLAGSPAINAGSNLLIPGGVTTDQRGAPFTRTSGTVDIGAFEVQSLNLVVDIATDEDDGNFGAGDLSLREAVRLANLNPGADNITFAAGLTAGGPATILLTNEIVVSGDVTIDASGAAAAITINGGAGTNRIFDVNANTTLALNTLTLTGGNGGGVNLNGQGGAINSQGALNLTNCTFFGNSGTFGGAIHSFNQGQLTIANSTFFNNSASNLGGAILDNGLNDAAFSTLTQCTFTGNSAGTGGAIFNFNTMKMFHCTVSGNTGGGGVSANFTSVMTLANNIIAGNTGGDLLISATASVTLEGANIIQVVNNSGGTLGGNTAINANPLLGPLANNGGPTQTMALLAGSPALNAGSNASIPVGVTTDQRGAGFARVGFITVDIGAFEAQISTANPIVVDSAGDELDGNISAGNLSLREAIVMANERAGADSITFAPGNNAVTLTIGRLELTDAALTTIDGGAGVSVSRSTAVGTPNFENFRVEAGAKAAFTTLTISNGRGLDGGGIQNFGEITVTNSTIRDNTNTTANSNGAGIENNQGTVTVIGSTISGNTANQGGGGLNNFQGTMTITNSTISGNSAGVAGGGILSNGGTLTVNNSTVTNNKEVNNALGGGGILRFGGASVTLKNTIVSGNFRANGVTRDDVTGAVVAASSNNLIGDGTFLTGITNGNQGNQIGTGSAPIDPLLGALANNGGPTQTHALLFGSPAIDGGSNANIPVGVNTDQRGLSRQSNTVDIGAFEHQGGTITTQVVQGVKPTDKQLVITGDGDLNRLLIALGTGGVKNSLTLTPAPGTVLLGPTSFAGITKGVIVNFLGGADMVTVNGTKVAGPITLNLADGDDTYLINASKTKFSLADSSGLDTVDFSSQNKGAKIDLAKLANKSQGLGNGNSAKFVNDAPLENVIGSPFNDGFKGNAANNLLIGNGGNDKLDGREGNDVLLGGAGNDGLIGGLGNDILIGGADKDSLAATDGFDLLIGGLGLDKLTGGKLGNSLLIGGSTTHDENTTALLAILGEWSSANDLNTRVANLQNGVGPGNAFKLVTTVPATVIDDALIETLTTKVAKNTPGTNWVLLGAGDKHKGFVAGDKVTT